MKKLMTLALMAIALTATERWRQSTWLTKSLNLTSNLVTWASR